MIEQASRGWRPYALLVLLCLGLYLPGLSSLPVTDRDEARFAQASRQMLETGDFIAIRFQDEARNQKPAGIYWLQAASVALLSDAKSTAIWPYRLPSLLGALAASLMTFGLGSALVGRKAALLGAALLAACLGLVAEAHLAKTDAVLLATITAEQLALARIYVAARAGRIAQWRFALLFWAALALGILVKGPVAPVVAALTIAALVVCDWDAAWLRALRPWRGLALLALIVLPWLIAISTATKGAFIHDSLGGDFLAKLIGAQQGHGAPPLYYLLLLAVTFWPGALFLGPAIAWAWRQRRAPSERFLIAWSVPFWLVLELVPTKLPNYLLPAYPALALMTGRALIALGDGEISSWPWLDRVVTLPWAAATLGIATVLTIAPQYFGNGFSITGLLAAAIAVYFATRATIAVWRKAMPMQAAILVILALVVVPLGFAVVAPRLDRLWLSRAAAGLVARNGPVAAPVIVAGYSEPSIVFLLGTATRFGLGDPAAAYLATARGALALVEAREDAAFQRGLTTRGAAARALGTVSGLDYSNGRSMTYALFRRAAMTGRLYGLGVGPGDPELITLKAWRLLRSAAVVAYPAPEEGASFARGIVAHWLSPVQVELAIRIPMEEARFPAQAVYDRAAADIGTHLDEGRDVAVLCQGDPFFYGSFMYLFGRLAERYTAEIVPGVSSLGACAAAAGFPLAARNDVLTVLPATLGDDELARRLEDCDAAAIIKLGRHFARVRALIEKKGLTGRAAYIEHASLATAKVLKLADVEPGTAPYFSMILYHRRGAAWR